MTVKIYILESVHLESYDDEFKCVIKEYEVVGRDVNDAFVESYIDRWDTTGSLIKTHSGWFIAKTVDGNEIKISKYWRYNNGLTNYDDAKKECITSNDNIIKSLERDIINANNGLKELKAWREKLTE